MIRQALISWYCKDGLIDFAQQLQQQDVAILATGGTADHLEQGGIACRRVESLTRFRDLANGRVKSLHPAVFAAILAQRDDAKQMAELRELGIAPIDLVSIDPYPFEQIDPTQNMSDDELVEWIDIGGPALLRSAAKNHHYVWAAVGRNAARCVLDWVSNCTDENEMYARRKKCAAGVFQFLSRLDSTIARRLDEQSEQRSMVDFQWPATSSAIPLRYGENPDQSACLIPTNTSTSDDSYEPDIRDWSYNNLLDSDAAASLCRELSRSTSIKYVAVLVKHNNPCGIGWGTSAEDAYRRAYLSDPQAAMGGVLACNWQITAEDAEMIMHSLDRWGRAAEAHSFFLDAWVAPKFETSAVQMIRSAKPWGQRVKLKSSDFIKLPRDEHSFEIRSIADGILFQSQAQAVDEQNWQCATQRTPSKSEWEQLKMAWAICRFAKSNAICLVTDGQLIGAGIGQCSRAVATMQAVQQACDHSHLPAQQPVVAASDGFFPFADSIELLAAQGVRAVIQPGGSKNRSEEHTSELQSRL